MTVEAPRPPVAWFGHAALPIVSARARARGPSGCWSLTGCLVVIVCRGHGVGRRVPRHPLRADRPDRRHRSRRSRPARRPTTSSSAPTAVRASTRTTPTPAASSATPACDCTDTIMVLRVDPKEKQAYLLSFPRDLYLPISGTGDTARINTRARPRRADADRHDPGQLRHPDPPLRGDRLRGVREARRRGGRRAALVRRAGPRPPHRPRRPAGRVRRAQRRAGAEVRPLALPRVPRRGRRLATATPPPTSAASPGSRCSCGARSPRP